MGLTIKFLGWIKSLPTLMYLARSFPTEDDDNEDLAYLKKDEALGLITLYVNLILIHHTNDKKGAKEIWDTSKTLFGMMNTT